MTNMLSTPNEITVVGVAMLITYRATIVTEGTASRVIPRGSGTSGERMAKSPWRGRFVGCLSKGTPVHSGRHHRHPTT